MLKKCLFRTNFEIEGHGIKQKSWLKNIRGRLDKLSLDQFFRLPENRDVSAKLVATGHVT